MNLTALEKKLIAAARTSEPDERVPYAFEKRIMARLSEAAPVDVLGSWGRSLWRAAVPCLAVAVLLAGWNLWNGESSSARADFSDEFEIAVLISAYEAPQ
jgi:hypothetical protein